MTGSNTVSSLLVAFIENLYRMAWIVEARDPYTGGHLWRVSQNSRMLAEDLRLGEDEVARIELGGFLHDLGKVGIPDAVLNKPGPSHQKS
jgi:response regulator RpfG family c-di-GMP phosphodiesterase